MSRWLILAGTVVLLAGVTATTHAGPAAPDSTSHSDSTHVALPPRAVRRWQVGLLRTDRLQHGSLSMTIGLAAGLLSRQASGAAAAGMGLGVAKELLDMRHGEFDVVDLAADAVGTAAAMVATHAVEH